MQQRELQILSHQFDLADDIFSSRWYWSIAMQKEQENDMVEDAARLQSMKPTAPRLKEAG